MALSKELRSHIDSSHPEVIGHIAALTKENAKALARIVELEAKSVSSDHRIEALEAKVADYAKKERSPLEGMSVRQKIAALTAARRRDSKE